MQVRYPVAKSYHWTAVIDRFRYIKIHLGSEAWRTQTEEIEWTCLFISFVFVFWASLSSWILIYRTWPIGHYVIAHQLLDREAEREPITIVNFGIGTIKDNINKLLLSAWWRQRQREQPPKISTPNRSNKINRHGSRSTMSGVFMILFCRGAIVLLVCLASFRLALSLRFVNQRTHFFWEITLYVTDYVLLRLNSLVLNLTDDCKMVIL